MLSNQEWIHDQNVYDYSLLCLNDLHLPMKQKDDLNYNKNCIIRINSSRKKGSIILSDILNRNEKCHIFRKSEILEMQYLMDEKCKIMTHRFHRYLSVFPDEIVLNFLPGIHQGDTSLSKIPHLSCRNLPLHLQRPRFLNMCTAVKIYYIYLYAGYET